MVDQDARFQQLMAQIELQRQAAQSPEIEALEADLASDEQNHEVRVKLAVQISSHGRYREALEHLLVVLRADRDWGNGEAKRVYLDMIATIGKGDPLAAEYQRKLFSPFILTRHAERVRRQHRFKKLGLRYGAINRHSSCTLQSRGKRRPQGGCKDSPSPLHSLQSENILKIQIHLPMSVSVGLFV